MPIKLNVPYNDKDKVKELGAWWFREEKTWVIPDSIIDINPFFNWLPKEEGFIVKWPYIILKSSRWCWKCGTETPLIALAAKSCYYLFYETDDDPKWIKEDEYPTLFCDISFLDHHFLKVLQEKYPFFQHTFSKTAKEEYIGNTCKNCNALQGDDYNFNTYGGPFCPIDKEEAKLIRKEYHKLKFDYYVVCSEVQSTSVEWFIK